MVQSNTKRSVLSPDIDGLELLLGRRSPAGSNDRRPAANAPPLGQAQLLDYLQRSLAGEPFPVSSPRMRTASEEAVPLALRIREILRAEQESERVAAARDNIAPTPPAAEAPPVQPARPSSPLIALQPPMALPPSPVAPRLPRSSIGWGSVAFMLLVTVGGACIPGMFAPAPRYMAEARLQLLGSAGATPGFIEATTLRLTSPRLLSQVVTRLKLDHDAEFSGGKATSYSIIMDLLNDSGAATDNFSRAQMALQKKLTVTPDRQSGTVALAAQSSDPKKSARIANLLADIAVRDAAAKPLASAPSEAETAVENDRKRYDAANAALATFKASAGDEKITEATDLMQRKEALGNQIAAAGSAAQSAAIRLSAAKAVKMADVLDGSISPDLGSPAPLEDLRNRYAAARSTLGQLSTQLGPRHPRLLAVQATIDTLSSAILAEIQKMVIASDAEVKTTGQQLKQLKDRLAELNGQTVDVDLAAFGQLQSDAEAARQAYETALATAEDARPASTTAEVPLALATPATPPAAPLDDNLIGRALIGALSGFALALALRGCRKYIGRRSRNTSPDESIVDFDMVDLLADLPETTPRARMQTSLAPQKQTVDVASDLSPNAVYVSAHQPDTALSAIIGDVASLRAKVATYVSERQAASR